MAKHLYNRITLMMPLQDSLDCLIFSLKSDCTRMWAHAGHRPELTPVPEGLLISATLHQLMAQWLNFCTFHRQIPCKVLCLPQTASAGFQELLLLTAALQPNLHHSSGFHAPSWLNATFDFTYAFSVLCWGLAAVILSFGLWCIHM